MIAATLLDIKAARLLPAGEVEDDEDMALLEARDLLFARLLQYKAFKHVAGLLGESLHQEAMRYPRQVALEEHSRPCSRTRVWHTPEQFAALAEAALRPAPKPTEVGLAHLHGGNVSVKEQAEIVGLRLQRESPLTVPQSSPTPNPRLWWLRGSWRCWNCSGTRRCPSTSLSPLADLAVHWTAGGRQWSAENLSEEFEEQL